VDWSKDTSKVKSLFAAPDPTESDIGEFQTAAPTTSPTNSNGWPTGPNAPVQPQPQPTPAFGQPQQLHPTQPQAANTAIAAQPIPTASHHQPQMANGYLQQGQQQAFFGGANWATAQTGGQPTTGHADLHNNPLFAAAGLGAPMGTGQFDASNQNHPLFTAAGLTAPMQPGPSASTTNPLLAAAGLSAIAPSALPVAGLHPDAMMTNPLSAQPLSSTHPTAQTSTPSLAPAQSDTHGQGVFASLAQNPPIAGARAPVEEDSSWGTFESATSPAAIAAAAAGHSSAANLASPQARSLFSDGPVHDSPLQSSTPVPMPPGTFPSLKLCPSNCNALFQSEPKPATPQTPSEPVPATATPVAAPLQPTPTATPAPHVEPHMQTNPSPSFPSGLDSGLAASSTGNGSATPTQPELSELESNPLMMAAMAPFPSASSAGTQFTVPNGSVVDMSALAAAAIASMTGTGGAFAFSTNPLATNPLEVNPLATNPLALDTSPSVAAPSPLATNPLATNPLATNPLAANPLATNPQYAR